MGQITGKADKMSKISNIQLHFADSVAAKLQKLLVRRITLRSLVIVLDADDVVLAEIAAGLDLDQLQHDLAGIFQPVDGADQMVTKLMRSAWKPSFADSDRPGQAVTQHKVRAQPQIDAQHSARMMTDQGPCFSTTIKRLSM
jgi:hypothetical protein